MRFWAENGKTDGGQFENYWNFLKG